MTRQFLEESTEWLATAIQQGLVTDLADMMMLLVMNFLGARLIDQETFSALCGKFDVLRDDPRKLLGVPPRDVTGRFEGLRGLYLPPEPLLMPKPDCSPYDIQTEALVLAQAICQRDALRASAALSCIYAQMDERALLAPHAYAIQTYIGAATYVQSVHQALLYLWYLRGFEAPTQYRDPTPDNEGPEP